jgi:hypothetical protein
MTSAITTLTRERTEAVDDRGRRTIRHSGEGALLISLADGDGRLLRQELVLGTEVIVWQHGTRIRTGLVPAGAADASAGQFDRQPSRSRLERARQAVEHYAGDDKFLLHLARIIALSAGLSLGGAEVVTRSAQDLRSNKQLQKKKQQRQPAAGPLSKTWALLGLVCVVVFVVVYFAAR